MVYLLCSQVYGYPLLLIFNLLLINLAKQYIDLRKSLLHPQIEPNQSHLIKQMPETRINTGFRHFNPLFKLNRSGRLTGNVIHYPVHMAHLVNNSAGHLL